MRKVYKNYKTLEDFEDADDLSYPLKLQMSKDYRSECMNNPINRRDWNVKSEEHLKHYWAYLERFIQSKIGVKYDDAYSEFCKKVPINVCGYDTRKNWKEYFEPKWGYYIDKEGYIRYEKQYRVIKGTPIEIPGSEKTEYFVIDKEHLVHHSLQLQLKFNEMFCSNVWYTLCYAKFIDPKDIDFLRQTCGKEIPIDSIFVKKIYNGRLIYNDNVDYRRYLHEYKKHKKKEKA